MHKLGCYAGAISDNDIFNNLSLIKKVGFDSTFLSWDDGVDIDECVDFANKLGLKIESLHAPKDTANDIWEVGDDGDKYTEKLRRCIKAAAKFNIPIVVLHTTTGINVPKTSPIGLLRFKKLIIEAERQGVKLAFENIKIIRNLSVILEYFKNDNVGLCYDCGHENCFTPGFRFMKLFGDRAFCTHIHDNYGLGDSKEVNNRDDLHRIPFECSIDFKRVCDDIKQSGYKGTLMLEIKYSKAEANTPEDFFKKAYNAAIQLRDMAE